MGSISKRVTRQIFVGPVPIGGDAPIAVQSMAATRTTDVEATVRQVSLLQAAGADLVRIAVDSRKDVEALAEVRRRIGHPSSGGVPLSVDLQENYRLAELVAPHVDKIRYNPGHLHHHEKDKPTFEKVRRIVEIAREHDLALRVGVNCGSVDPAKRDEYPSDDVGAMVASALEHCAILDELGFDRYVVSMKDSDWRKVVEGNRRFASERPDVPLHLGVTEAGLPPDGIIKTRVAFEQLLSQGVGDTVRVSLTVPFEEKGLEIQAGREIIADIEAGRFRSVPDFTHGLNIISCPSCSRVENEAFVALARDVKEMAQYAKDFDVTIAVMGCRVNGPGETDDADLGLWCGPTGVNVKRGEESVGHYPYDSVLGEVRVLLDELIASQQAAAK